MLFVQAYRRPLIELKNVIAAIVILSINSAVSTLFNEMSLGNYFRSYSGLILGLILGIPNFRSYFRLIVRYYLRSFYVYFVVENFKWSYLFFNLL